MSADPGAARPAEGVEPDGLEVREVSRALDEEWDEAFGWSYGPRFWNVGCG